MRERDILKSIIDEFYIEKFKEFFRAKNDKLSFPDEALYYEYNESNFTEGRKLARGMLDDGEIIVCSFLVKKELTDRSGKKAQYALGKQILKQYQADAGIFIFYDNNGNFRFSLIYTDYLGIRREYSSFKRFTYFVSPEQTNKTFLEQIGEGDFSSLQKIKEAFSVEPVTKQFYNEIQSWYFWAMDKVKFPDDYKYSTDPQKDIEIRNATSLIRLITRIIFIWFLKEKKLIPVELFSKEELENIVKDFYSSNKSSNYYNAILQNLFFGTLNQRMSERRFANEGNFNANKREYGVKNIYRYANKFKITKKDKIRELFKDIPFLNGGLFDCLDKEDESGKVIYIDGFSRNPKKQSIIPDFLFFQENEDNINLSEYGLGRKTVRGLIDILNSYNFTIDENTPIDQEIALDPELLGKMFENLLASYNPETATTARKATGSYYTPRDIVDYMVETSLFEYLKVKLPKVDEEKIKILLSYSENTPEFLDEEKKRIISEIDEIKILDPACGSGAFPMGVLHKLVYILQKLDSENKYWHELQYQKALKETEEIFKQGDKEKREERLKEINETFDKSINYPDYARKLYLIENCIYGVDIQPIAIQISKLRFFISLVLDQKVDSNKENLGIRALPNLETKFVSANTLIDLEKKQLSLRNPVIESKEKELKTIRHKYFTANTRSKKQEYKTRDKQLREEIAKFLIDDGWSNTTAKKIAKVNLYDQNTSADWFDSEWMFGVMDGFDIVIGNPPYIQLQKAYNDSTKYADLYKDQDYSTFDRTGDIYCLFYEKGMKLLKQNGVLAYITSNKWMRAGYGQKLRDFFTKYYPLQLIDLGPGVFENATVDTNILIIRKSDNQNQLKAVTLQKEDKEDIAGALRAKGVLLTKLSKDAWFIGTPAEIKLKEKIERIGKPLKDWDVNIYYGIKTGLNEAFVISTEKRNEILANCKDKAERKRTEAVIKKILRGRDIKRYYYNWAGLWVIVIPADWTNKNKGKQNAERFIEKKFPSLIQHLKQFEVKARKRDDQGDYWWELRHCAYYPEFEKEKVVWQRITQKPTFCLVEPNVFILDSMAFFAGNNLKFIMAILNSKIIYKYVNMIVHQYGFTGFRLSNQYVEIMPLPPITQSNETLVKQIEALVDKILAAKKQNPNADTNELEREIDELVYRLYELTEEEIGIIER